jgi:hypothetical protein
MIPSMLGDSHDKRGQKAASREVLEPLVMLTSANIGIFSTPSFQVNPTQLSQPSQNKYHMCREAPIVI